MAGDLTWGGEHTTQYTDDVLQNCTPETYIILLTNVTPINSIKIKKYLPYHRYICLLKLGMASPLICPKFLACSSK